MSNYPEVIVLSDSDDELIPNFSKEINNHVGGTGSGTHIKDEEQDLPDIDSDCTNYRISEQSKKYTKTKARKHSSYLRNRHGSDSSDSSDIDNPHKSVKATKNKKSNLNLNISKGIHDTSTDEIDSDQCSPSKNIKIQETSSAVKSTDTVDSQQPCCSKSLRFEFSPVKDSKPSKASNLPTVSLSSSDAGEDDDFELPDIEPVSTISNSNGPKPTTYIPLMTNVVSSSSTAAININKKSAELKLKKKEEEAEKRKAAKEQKKIERDLKKAELEREKALKKSANEIQRNSKPGEAVKFITIIVDHEISEQYGTLIPLFDAADLRYEIKYGSVIANSFTFKRETIHQAMGDDLQLHKVSSFSDEDQLMILLDSKEAIPMIHAYLKKDADDHDGDSIDIITWIESIKCQYALKKITLFFIGMENYYKKIKKNVQQEFRDRVLNVGNQGGNPKRKQTRKAQKQLPDVSKLEVQSSLIDMQIRTEVNYRMVKNINELGSLLIQYAKAIAEAPFKRQKMTDNKFDWYALADSSGSVKVDKDGNGLRALWILQLQCFNNVGEETAKAIAEKYPSPQALTNAFVRCPTVEDGLALLKDIKVKLGIGPLAKYRNVGPELSKRMYRYFTSSDGEKFLSSTADM